MKELEENSNKQGILYRDQIEKYNLRLKEIEYENEQLRVTNKELK